MPTSSVRIVRSAHRIAADAAEGAEGIGHEGVGVKPLQDLFGSRAVRGQRRIGDLIGALAGGARARVVSTADDRERQAALERDDAGRRTSRRARRSPRGSPKCPGNCQRNDVTKRWRRSKLAGPQSKPMSFGLVTVCAFCLFSDESSRLFERRVVREHGKAAGEALVERDLQRLIRGLAGRLDLRDAAKCRRQRPTRIVRRASSLRRRRSAGSTRVPKPADRRANPHTQRVHKYVGRISRSAVTCHACSRPLIMSGE